MGAMLETVKGPGRCAAMVALAVGSYAALAAPAPARTLDVRLSAPSPSLTGVPCRVSVAVATRIHRATALLQERHGRHWHTVARKRLLRRSVTLSCPVARAPGTRRFRGLVRRADRTLARSAVLAVRVTRPPQPGGSPPPAAPPPAPAPPVPPRPPLNPAQFGAEGTGGPPSPATLALLANPNLIFDANGVADLQAGRIDPRVVAVLGSVAQGHVLTVSALCTGSPKLTTGGAVSTHYLGRGVDIAAIDGVPVTAVNATARGVADALASLDPSYRPDEVGTPFSINLPGYFMDASTQNLLHIAFKQPIDPSWSPP
jgi:hypothetical protein